MHAQCMISNNNITSDSLRRCVNFVVTFFKNNIIRFGFCDSLNNQGLSKYYQPRPSAWLITLTSTLIILDITKTSSNVIVYNNYYLCLPSDISPDGLSGDWKTKIIWKNNNNWNQTCNYIDKCSFWSIWQSSSNNN